MLRLETHDAADVAGAREAGFAALKTIAAYRGGLDRVSEQIVAALEANEATGDPLPVQVHCGFGDADLHLWRADPSYLKPLIERFRETPFVLLHCYPFVREAGWLAHVYGNVWFDLSLTIPHVARPAEHVREALELAPVSKLLYASDAARTPELYFLAAKWWREALAEVLAEALPPDEAEAGGARDPARQRARAVPARIRHARLTRWRVHGEHALYSSEWLNVRLVEVELPDGTRFDHHVVRMPHPAVGVIVRDAERGILLLRRHRFITDTWGWEIPAGARRSRRDARAGGERESIEETGWRPLDLEQLGFSHPTNGLMDQRFEYFLAPRAEHVGEFDRTETESIAWFAPDDVRTLIEQGEIPDGLSVTALGMAFTLGRL